MKFDYAQDFNNLDFRAHPERYQIGIGEQGVLSVEPYKSEILPYWRFATPEVARESSDKIYAMFLEYKAAEDFVGMDMARKFLQMGYTRARRYANHRGGKKYDGPVPADKKGQSGAHGRKELPRSSEDPIKAEAARIFYEKYQQAKSDPDYIVMAQRHRERFENQNGITMKLGFLTGYSAERVEFAQTTGFTCLELSAGPGSPLDPNTIGDHLAEIKDTLAQHSMTVSALACYLNHLEAGREEEHSKYFQSVLKLAPKLGCSVVATMSGCTAESRKSGDISQSLDAFQKAFSEHARVAEGSGVKIAFENWPGGHPCPLLVNIAVSPRAWEQMFDAVPSPALGLEYDPSHLARLQIDYIVPLRSFADRIHHVHAKDTTVDLDMLNEVGYIGQGWWHYSIPSRGMVEWPEFFRELKAIGYRGDVDIEHEDPAFEGDRFDNGLRLGYSYLSQLIY